MDNENYYVPEEKHHLITDNLDLIHHILKKHFNLPEAVYEDCFQEGVLAMMLAINRFDDSRGTKFTTFAYSYILGYVRKYIKSQAPSLKYPTRMQDTRSKVEALIEDGLNQEEICLALDITEYQYSEIVRMGETVSLNSTAHVSSEGGVVLYEEVIRDGEDHIENYVKQETIMGHLQALLPKVRSEDRALYLEYIESVIEGAPFRHKVIAEKYCCPVAKVASIIKKYNRLLKIIAKKEDYIYD